MIQQQMNRQYLSTMDFMDQREILNKVLDLYDEEETIVDIMKMTSRYAPTSQEVYRYHVNTRLHSAAIVAGITAAPAVGAQTTVTLTAGSVKPRVNDIMLTSTGHRAFVRIVAGNVITLNPVDSSVAAHAGFAANDQVTFFTNGYGEGTDVNPGYIYGTELHENNIQIIKGDFSVTDLQAMTKVEVEFNGKPYYFIKGQHDAFQRFKMDVAYAILLGKRSVGLTDAGGKNIYLTHGLEESIRDNGVELPMSMADNATFATNFRSITRALDQARGPAEYWMWNGPNRNNFIDDWLGTKTELVNGGVTYGSFSGISGDAKKRAVELGFDSFKLYGRTWHKKVLRGLDNPELTAATGFVYPDICFMIPVTKVKCNYDGEQKERFRIRYFEGPKAGNINISSSKEYQEILTGGLAPTPTNKFQTLDISYSTWQGAEFLGLEHFAINS